jgi:hypothetical protein
MRASHRVGAIVVCVTAMLLTACGGGSGNDVSTNGSTTSTSSTTSTTSTTGCSLPGADTGSKSATGPDTVSLLTQVRTGGQPCADRVTFEFRDGSPPAYTVEYQTGPFTQGESGQPLAVQGSAFLVVHFPHASGFDLTSPNGSPTYTGPESIVPTGLAHIRDVRRLEDFEAVLVWVIGLDSTRPFTVGVLDGPPRIYIDIG